jgi:hypothetical protein
MDWLETEIHARRDQLYAEARQARLIRTIKGDVPGIRGRIADSADAVSAVLATLAHALREHEA